MLLSSYWKKRLARSVLAPQKKKVDIFSTLLVDLPKTNFVSFTKALKPFTESAQKILVGVILLFRNLDHEVFENICLELFQYLSQKKIITLWSHVFAPILREIGNVDDEQRPSVSYNVAHLLVKSRTHALSTWPHDLQAIANLFQGSILTSDLNTIDKHTAILFIPLPTELIIKLIKTIIGNLTEPLSVEWQKGVAMYLTYLDKYDTKKAEEIKKELNTDDLNNINDGQKIVDGLKRKNMDILLEKFKIFLPKFLFKK